LPDADNNDKVNHFPETHIEPCKYMYLKVFEKPAFDSTYTANVPNTPPMNTCDTVTNTSTDIGVDEYGYNVTTQSTDDRRNIPTDTVYNKLAL